MKNSKDKKKDESKKEAKRYEKPVLKKYKQLRHIAVGS